MVRVGSSLYSISSVFSKPLFVVLSLRMSLLSVPDRATAQSWSLQHPPPSPGWVLQAVDLVDSTHLWVVGNDGLILFSSNGGWQTATQNSLPSLFLEDVEFTDTLSGWVVGEEFVYPSSFRGKIFSTTNGGQTWSDQSVGQNWPRLSAVNFLDRQHGWACGFNGAMLHTTNGGAVWSHDTVGNTTSQFNDIQFFDERIGWLGERRKLYKTTNGGGSWIALSDTGASSLFILDSLRVWVTGGDIYGSRFGPIRKTKDGGSTWMLQYEPEFEISPTKISFTDSLNGWCALWDQRQDPPPLSHRISMVHTTDGGNTWSEQYMGGIPVLGLSFDGAGNGSAVGLGQIMYSSDHGVNWIRRTNGIYTDLNAVQIVDSLDAWAAGNERTLLHTTNGGLRWFSTMSPALARLDGVRFVGKQHGWAAGGNTVSYTTDGGVSWVPSSTAVSSLCGLSFVDTLSGWAVGNGIICTTNGGVTWFPQVPISNLLYAVDFLGRLHGWVVGVGGEIWATTSGGVNWFTQPSNTPSHLTAVDFIDTLRGWAVGANGAVVRTSNGGSTWLLQNSQTSAWLWGVKFVDALVGCAVGESGIILVTTDGGNNWVRQNSGTTQSLYAIDFWQGQLGWTVGAGGLIMRGGPIVGVGGPVPSHSLSFSLCQNYPNPFNPETRIQFTLANKSKVSLKVFDVLGREVAILVDDERDAGNHVVAWNSSGVSSGVYYYQLHSGTLVATRKMVLIR